MDDAPAIPRPGGEVILQSRLPFTPWADPGLARLPGMMPAGDDWIVVDDAYAGQMALRRRLVNQHPADVVRTLVGSEAAQAEALDTMLAALPSGFRRDGTRIVCPDGHVVRIDAPLPTLARLFQEDVLLLIRDGREHVLVAGLLCFPASWTLAEKIGRPLAAIHAPVPHYDAALAARVQRLFDRAPPGRAIWRANVLGYRDPALHQPRPEGAPRPDGPARFLRCERQTVLRLPRSDAILFAVHTYLLRPDALTPRQRTTCPTDFAL